MNKLEKVTNEQFTPLLKESENAFLPAKNRPNQTASLLIDKFKNDKRYDVFGYIVDDKAASYIVALSGRQEGEIAIGPMYVAEAFRGSGLGKQQVIDFIHLFASQGYKSIYTKTWLGNAASRHIFESLGFIETNRENGDRVGGDSTISYTLHVIHEI